MGIRVRWRGVGKVVGLVAAAAIAAKLLPGAFAAPQAPPLAPDVGLAGVAVERAAPEVERVPRPERARPARAARARPSHGVAPASAVIGTTPRRRKPEPPTLRRCPNGEFLSVCERNSPTTPAAPAPSPPPEPVAPQPAPPPSPPASAPQPAPEDGSMEFAPH